MLAVLPAALLTIAFVWSLVDAPRHPERWRHLGDERLWGRVHAWVWGVTLAVLAGMALGGATAHALGIVAALGLIAGWITWRLLVGAYWRNRRP